MSVFAGIVPCERVALEIRSIQEPFGDNRLEPHITVLPPLQPGNLDTWVETLTTVSKNTSPFQVELTGTGHFGNGVLFISVAAPPLDDLFRQLKAATINEPAQGKPDSRPFHAHLTLGRRWCGFTTDGFREMDRLAKLYLSSCRPNFEVQFLRVYQKPPGGRYKQLVDLPFGS